MFVKYLREKLKIFRESSVLVDNLSSDCVTIKPLVVVHHKMQPLLSATSFKNFVSIMT